LIDNLWLTPIDTAADHMQTLDLLDFELPAARFYPTASPPSAVITTNFGDITIELFPEKAPLSVGNFLHYAFDNYYDNVLFHRVVNNFVIQAGLLIPKAAQR
jgi:hypothetical protein